MAILSLRARHLPVALAVVMTTGIIVSYSVSVARKDVTALLPFISDTGATQPASAWFGLFMNMAAFIAGLLIYIRYKQCVAYAEYENRIARANSWSLLFGGLSAFGMMIVGNFQDNRQSSIHLIGAFLVFVGAQLYGGVQTWIAARLGQDYVPLRAALIAAAVVIFLLGTVLQAVAVSKLPDLDAIEGNCTVVVSDSKPNRPWPGYWPDCLPGYELHVAASFCEWILSALFLAYFMFYARDLRDVPVALIVSVHGQMPEISS
eukprot:m.23506 g.23506  ORF g.23506 m.23506 type:complete len:262 (+) comp3912_c0_seq1:20-805(+)